MNHDRSMAFYTTNDYSRVREFANIRLAPTQAMNEELTIISPHARQNESVINACRQLWREIVVYRWQIAMTIRRDFARASQLSRFGSFWNYLLPVVPISVYAALMAFRVLPTFGSVNGLVYVALGVTLWLAFAGIVQRTISVLESRFRELTNTQIPMIAAILASFAELLFETAVRLTVIVPIFLALQGIPAWQIVFVPLVLTGAVCFFLPLGLTFSILNLAYRDVGKIVRLALQYGIFLSGVIFPIGALPFLGASVAFNPFYVFIESVRSLATTGACPFWPSLIAFSVIGGVAGLFVTRAFYALELRLRGLV